MQNTMVENEKLTGFLALFQENYEVNGFHSAIMHAGFRLFEAVRSERSVASSNLEKLYSLYEEYLGEVTGRMELDRLIEIRSDFVRELLSVAERVGFNYSGATLHDLSSLIR